MNVNWYRFGKPYYERSGVGLTMKSGFVIIVLADDYLETYVFNAGTSELLFSMTRSGGSALSNAMKSQRGILQTSRGDGALKRPRHRVRGLTHTR